MAALESNRTGRPLLILGAVMLGFFLGEIAVLLVRAPGLLQPSHWPGLGALLASALLLYAGAGVYFLLFYVMLRIISAVLRLRFSPAATALITALTALPFLLFQNGLQKEMLGTGWPPALPVSTFRRP